MKVRVNIYKSAQAFGYTSPDDMIPDISYVMDHDDPAQRRVLGEQCRNAFEARQMVVTYAEPEN